MSPKFRQEQGYTFKIYSNEEERKHIHVVKADIELANNHGFRNKDIREITQLVEQYGNEFKQQFAAHIGKRVDD